MVSKSSHSNLILGNLCHIHCYCCRCFFFLLCAIWKINKTITKRITEKGHFLMSRDFLHEFVHVCRGILTRAWFVRNYLYWYSAPSFLFFFDIEYILITFLSQREVSNNFFLQLGINNCYIPQASNVNISLLIGFESCTILIFDSFLKDKK